MTVLILLYCSDPSTFIKGSTGKHPNVPNVPEPLFSKMHDDLKMTLRIKQHFQISGYTKGCFQMKGQVPDPSTLDTSPVLYISASISVPWAHFTNRAQDHLFSVIVCETWLKVGGFIRMSFSVLHGRC